MNNRALIFKMIIFYDMSRSFYWYQDICNLVTFVIFGIGCFWKHLCFRNTFCYINHILRSTFVFQLWDILFGLYREAGPGGGLPGPEGYPGL